MVEDEEGFRKFKVKLEGQIYHIEAKVVGDVQFRRLKIRSDMSQEKVELLFGEYSNQIASTIDGMKRAEENERDLIENFENYNEEKIRERLREMKYR